MTQANLPCAYYPTTVVFVDDDKKFVDRMNLAFGQKIPRLVFNNSEQTLKFFKDGYHSNPFTNRCIHEPTDQDSDKRNVEIRIRDIRQEIYNPLRYSEISVVVLDYMMPGLNGGDLAKQLKSFPFKIILLTGAADQKIAIELFNQGIIQKYIRKDDSNFVNILDEAIKNLQLEYFQDLSEPILNSLEKSPDYPHNWFKKDEFKILFNQLKDDHHAVEYYLLDEMGSYLFLDKDAKPSWFVAKNEKEIEGLIAHAEFEDAPSDSILEILKGKQYIPFFYSDKDLQSTPSEWEKYFHPAKKLANSDYYYAYVPNSNAYDIQPEKITSYTKYLLSL